MPELLPLAIGMDQAWILGGVKSVQNNERMTLNPKGFNLYAKYKKLITIIPI